LLNLDFLTNLLDYDHGKIKSVEKFGRPLKAISKVIKFLKQFLREMFYPKKLKFDWETVIN